MAKVRAALGADVYRPRPFRRGDGLFADMSLSDKFEEFLTLPAYRLID